MSKRLTEEKRQQMLALHQAGKRQQCEALCVKYGVSSDYARQLASRRGLPPKYREYPINRNRPDDPRWERAKAIGPVVA